MSIEELLEIAEENHWAVDWTVDGELVFFTGVVDESQSRAADAEVADELPEPGGEIVEDDFLPE